MTMTTITYQFRIKDKSIRDVLKPMSSHVNFIWNYSRDIIDKNWKESRMYTSRSLLASLTKGASKELSINSQTIQAVYEEHLLRTQKTRKHVRKRSRKRNLGWIPFKGQSFKFLGNYCVYNGHKIRYWLHRPLPEGYVIRTGSFSEDSQGRWYLNLVVSFPEYLEEAEGGDVGIDMGIITTMATSDKELLERPNFSTQNAEALAKAQKKRQKRKVKKIHAKIKNQRKDWNHKRTFEIAKKYRRVFVGNAASKDILTDISNINKAVYDASWYNIKTLLSYKVLRRRGVYLEVSEHLSNETCSECLKLTKQKLSLDVRWWTCEHCGAKHHRDINAAISHRRFGSETLSRIA